MIRKVADNNNGRKNKIRKNLALMLVLILVLTLFPSSYTAKASGSTGSSNDTDPEENTGSKTAEVNDAESLIAAFADESVDTIVLTCDINISSAYVNPKSTTAILTADRNLLVRSKGLTPYKIKRTNDNVTVKEKKDYEILKVFGPNYTYYETKNYTSPTFQKSIIEVWGNGVEDGVIVALKNVILDGGAVWQSDFRASDMAAGSDTKSNINSGLSGRAIVDIANMGTLNLESNCTLQNSDVRTNSPTRSVLGTSYHIGGSWSYGGAVRIDYNAGRDGGHVNLKTGSLIKDCYAKNCGGGVGAYCNGVVNMYGGKIERCSAQYGGGIGLTYRSGMPASKGGRVNFHGGYIKGCYADYAGGGIYSDANTTNNLFGGKILECNTGFIGSFQMYGGAMYFSNTPILRLADAYTFKTSMIGGMGNYDDSGFSSANGIYIAKMDDIDTPESVMVSFVSDEEVLSELNFEIGSTAGEAVPMGLEKADYLFCGWYTDTEYTKHFNKKSIIDQELTVYAKWAYLVDAEASTDKYSKEAKFKNGNLKKPPFETYTLGSKKYSSYLTRKDDASGKVTSKTANKVDKGWNTTETYLNDGSLFEWLYTTYSAIIPLSGYTVHMLNDYNEYLPLDNNAIKLTTTNCGALYQDISTYPNDVLKWSFKHAMMRMPGSKNDGSAYQIIKVEMGKPEGDPEGFFTGEGNGIKTHIQDASKYIYNSQKVLDYRGNEIYINSGDLDGLSLSSAAGDDKMWHNVSGAYKVPEGQTSTRFLIMNDDIMPGNGDLLKDFEIYTILGNVTAKKDSNNKIVIKGYWGEKDKTKKILINVGKKYAIADMTKVVNSKNRCFTITLDSTFGANARSVKISHEDYDLAQVTIQFE